MVDVGVARPEDEVKRTGAAPEVGGGLIGR